MSRIASILNWKNPALFDRENPLCIWLNVLNVTFISMLVMVDLLSSVIVTSEMQGYLAIDSTRAVWLGKSFFFGAAMMPLVSVYLANRFGYKRILFLGNIIFSIGAIGTGFSTNYYEMLFFRLLGGMGGGMIMSISLTIISYTVAEKERSAALIAYSNLFFGGGIIIGLILGGYVAQTMHWRLLFLMNMFLSLPTLVLTWILIPEAEKQHYHRFDYLGFFSLASFCFSLLLIVTQAKAPWNTLGWRSPFIQGCATTACISLLLFLYALFTKPEPIISRELLKSFRFWIGCIGLFIIGLMVFGPSIVLVSLLENIYLYDRITIGIMISLVGGVYLLLGVFTTLFSSMIQPRIFVLAGLFIVVLTCFFSQVMTIQSSPFEIGQVLVLRSIGIGMVLGPLAVLSLAPFQEKEAHHAIAVLTFVRQMAATFGSVLIDLVIAERSPYHALRFGEQVDVYSARFQQYIQQFDIFTTSIVGSGSLGLRQARHIVMGWVEDQAIIASFNDALWILGWITTGLLCIIVALMTIRISLKLRSSKQLL